VVVTFLGCREETCAATKAALGMSKFATVLYEIPDLALGWMPNCFFSRSFLSCAVP
jgi:hypothetical protein